MPTGLYFLLPILRINFEVLAGKLFEWDDFSLVDPVSIWRHGNRTRGARFMIKKNPIALFLPLVPETSIIICADYWFLEPMVKIVQWDFSLIIT